MPSRQHPVLLSLLCVALLSASSGSCVRKRRPVEPVSAAVTPNAGVGSPAPSAPRGKYGEVRGEPLLPATGVHAFELVGQRDRASATFVAVEGQPFTEALRAEVKQASAQPWDVQVQTRVGKAVNAGDVLLASFYVRGEPASGAENEVKTEFVMELAREPWTKTVMYPLRPTREWRQIFVRFTAAQAFAPGEAQLIFRLGYTPETLEIAGIDVENFGKQLALQDLPTTQISYAGSEPDAPWRKAAAERIDQLRKTNFSLSVRDRSGKPISGAAVALKQLRSSFGFGSAVVAQRLTLPGNDRYQALIPELFNTAVLENNLKWQPLAGDWGDGWNLTVAKQGVDWLTQHGIATRGHVLVWPSFRHSPRFLQDLKGDREKLRDAIRRHVRELASEMRGKLAHWDVMNEPFDNHDFMDLLGNDVMVEWFREARAADPGARLFINDYAILSGGGGTTPHRDHYEKTIRFLIERGAPLDAIGMQGHFESGVTAPEDLLKILDRFAKLGKPIWITEYDIDTRDESLAAAFTRDFYTTLFSHPAVEGILMWGFWDGAHHRANAPLYRRDWSLKPAGQAYRDLVLRDFRSNPSGVTDDTGTYATRAFTGTYELSVSAGGKTKRERIELRAGMREHVLSWD